MARTQKHTPCWRYHTQHGAKLLSYDDELEKLGDGWVDHPGKLKKLPGHEKLYETYINPIVAKKVLLESGFLIKTDEEKQQEERDAEDALALKLKNEENERAKIARETPVVYSCPLCDAKFSKERQLHMHKITKHRDKKVEIVDNKTSICEQSENKGEQSC
ncbi:MAG: optineurin-like protein [Podoviridae sp. cty5g4]|nr:MAG: optineurin-like protein [Podoviridae sp. cty5g4]